MASSNSTSTNSTIEDGVVEGGQSSSKKRRSRAALFSDDCRLKIIEEIYKLRFVWDTDSRDSNTVSPGVRKKAFGDIAARISNQGNTSNLNGEDVERQWKNLKDTYVKIRKKLPTNNASTDATTASKPRWRFYRILQFIDSDENVSRDFDFRAELALLQNEQRKQNTTSTPNTTSSPAILTTFIQTPNATNATNANTPIANNINVGTAMSNGISSYSNVPKQNGVLPPIVLNARNVTSHQLIQSANRLKRPADTHITYIRQNPPITRQHVNSNGIEGDLQEESTNVPTMNGLQMNGLNPDDEYGIFCNSLIHPLREIGSQDKLEYLNLKKFIHDKLYEVQARLHTRTLNGNQQR